MRSVSATSIEQLLTFLAIGTMALVLGLVIWPRAQHILYPHSQLDRYYTSIALLSTVKIEGGPDIGATATAFAADDEYVLTAGHFCSGARKLYRNNLIEEQIAIVRVNPKGFPILPIYGHVKAVDLEKDLCLIHAPGHAVTPLPFAEDISLLETEDPLIIIGAPDGIFPVRRDARLVSIEAYRFPGSEDRLLLTASVQSGSSGSPVIWEGLVVGMIVIQLPKISDGALATSVVDIQSFLHEHLD